VHRIQRDAWVKTDQTALVLDRQTEQIHIGEPLGAMYVSVLKNCGVEYAEVVGPQFVLGCRGRTS